MSSGSSLKGNKSPAGSSAYRLFTLFGCILVVVWVVYPLFTYEVGREVGREKTQNLHLGGEETASFNIPLPQASLRAHTGDSLPKVHRGHANSVLHDPRANAPVKPPPTKPPPKKSPPLPTDRDLNILATNPPHAGVNDDDDDGDYNVDKDKVHDPTSLRLNPPALDFDHGGMTKERACQKGGARGNGDADYIMLNELSIYGGEFHPSSKLFCTIYTYEAQHEKVMPALRETWAKRCDGFMASSTATDKNLSTVYIPHEGPEEYNNIAQKIRSTWLYIHDNYVDDYEWFYIGGDDVYVLVENLKYYLGSEEIRTASEFGEKPLFLGRKFNREGKPEWEFNAGGPGYLLNRAALKALVMSFNEKDCAKNLKGFWEDVMVSNCLKKMGIQAFDTRDSEGRERFLPFNAGHHMTYTTPKPPKKDWYTVYSIGLKYRKECCSVHSCTFHYLKPPKQYRYEALLYGLCD